MGALSAYVKYRCCVITAIIVMLSGCNALTPFDSDLAAWEGHSVSELIDSWGEPDNTRTISNNLDALTWVDPAGTCEQTFTVTDGIITGYSEYGC